MHALTGMRRLAAVAGSLAMVATMAACADSSEPTGGLAIVLGARSNMPAPTLDSTARAALETAVLSQSYLSIVVADGAPFEFRKGRLLADDTNAQVQDRDRQHNRDMVNTAVAEAAARTPESDLLLALGLASRSLAEAGGRHTVVVVDSGLSTAGPLDFTQPGLVDADPERLVAGLEAVGALPDLTGVDVVFQGLGDTAPPQQPISQAQRTNLGAIWQAIVAAAGGRGRTSAAPLSGEPLPGLPWVTPVLAGAGPVCTVESVVLTEGDVAFQPDSAEFVDPEAVDRTLAPIADRMIEGRLTATITGMTARVGSTEGQRLLSEQRAHAVRAALVRLRVPADTMTVVGVGSDFPGYDADDQAANRKVGIELSAPSADVTCALG